MIERVTAAWRPEWSRYLATVAIIFAVGFTVFILLRQSWVMSDGLVYREAGERLRNGEPLYIEAAIGERSYRYAPWFAFAWMLAPVPDWLWLAAMAVCAVLAVIPAMRSGALGVALGALIFPYLLIAAMGGHVQPAMIALLVFGVTRRWGPIAIAVAASLKALPLLYVLVYLARRQWGMAAVTLVLTAILVAPILLFDLRNFPADTSGAWGLFEWSAILWAIVVIGLAAFVWFRPAWLPASVLVMLSIPKFVYYDVSYLLVGPGRRTDHGAGTTGPVADSP